MPSPNRSGINKLPPEALLNIFSLGRSKNREGRAQEPDYANLKVRRTIARRFSVSRDDQALL